MLDAILQRVAVVGAASRSGPSGGNQIDMHAVIIRGGCSAVTSPTGR